MRTNQPTNKPSTLIQCASRRMRKGTPALTFVILHWIVYLNWKVIQDIQDDIFLKSLEKWKIHDQLDNTNGLGERLFHQTNFNTALAIIAGDHHGLVDVTEVFDVTEIIIARKSPLAQESQGVRRHRDGDRHGATGVDRDDDRGLVRNIARKSPLTQESREKNITKMAIEVANLASRFEDANGWDFPLRRL
jgi:hypothetical protein